MMKRYARFSNVAVKLALAHPAKTSGWLEEDFAVWSAACEPVPALDGEVCLWLVRLDCRAESIERLSRLLSDDERRRVARFHFRRDAARFVVGRAALRTILGEVLRVEPRTIRLTYGPYGKPELGEPFDRAGLRFNLSHSDSVGLCAVTRRRRVGVDIERLRPVPEWEAIADRMFSPQECHALRRLPAAQRREAFFSGWTRREAYAKALGEGFSARLEDLERDPPGPPRWSLEALVPEPGYVAAVAVEGQISRLVRRTWPPATDVDERHA